MRDSKPCVMEAYKDITKTLEKHKNFSVLKMLNSVEKVYKSVLSSGQPTKHSFSAHYDMLKQDLDFLPKSEDQLSSKVDAFW